MDIEKLVEEIRSSLLSEEEFLNVKQAAAFTKLKVQTIYNYVNQDKIPHIKKFGNLLFHKPALIKWMLDSTQGKRSLISVSKKGVRI